MSPMESAHYIYWQDRGQWLGYLQGYPYYWTQGQSLEELQPQLRSEKISFGSSKPVALSVPHGESTIGIITRTTKMSQPVPRHTEINEHLAKRILKLLANP
jgi:hypothetical protein